MIDQKLPDLLAGVYRHYKGPLYQVLGLAHDANGDELWDKLGLDAESLDGRVVVVYIGLETKGAHTGPRLAVRTLEDFLFPHMHRSDRREGPWNECYSGCYLSSTRHVPRFEYQGPGL